MLHQPVGAGGGGAGEVSTLLDGLRQTLNVNLVKNSPGQIITAAAEPQWWDDVANATLTDVGDGTFQVVTIANDVYGYQTLTFADEELLEAGQTVVSFSCYVYCATGSKASIGIYGTNLGLQESSQASAGTWELLKVENITLDGADTAIELRLIVDTDTALFKAPMLNPGRRALPWRPRGQKFVPIARATQLSLNAQTDIAWTNTDCTANTNPLCTAISIYMWISETDGTLDSYLGIGHSNIITGGDSLIASARVQTLTLPGFISVAPVFCDDSQVIRYIAVEVDNDSDLTITIYITGYWRWE